MAGLRGEARRAVVAAGDHHDDAVAPRLLHGVGQRVEPVVLGAVGAVGEVEDPDVESGVVAVLHDPVDGGDDLRHVGRAVGAPTLRLTMRAPGATPRKPDPLSLPAMMPAMWVP